MSETTEPAPMMSAEDFFTMFTKDMDGDDQMPMMYYYVPDGAYIVVFDNHGPNMDMQRMIKGLLLDLQSKVGKADWIWMASEAYAKAYPKEGNPTAPKPTPGSLQENFGTDPTITEIVMIAGVGPDGTIMGQRQFKREGDQIVWLSELETVEGIEVGGGIADLLRQAVK